MSNGFTICIRKRPCFGEQDVVKTTSTTISVSNEKTRLNQLKYNEVKTFTFDSVFSEKDNTRVIYNAHVGAYVENSSNFVCYTFGETGSGKTHTLFGPDGLIETTINDLLQRYSFVMISSYEIYKSQMFDLLNKKERVQMLEQGKEIHMHGLSAQKCDRANLLKVLENIKNNRMVGESSENFQSSRSHCLVNIKVNGKNYVFVDLAGSEKVSKRVCQNRKEFYEMADINLDIFALKECIRHMKGERNRIPFRSTKLTMALRQSFYDQYKTLMICTISPEKSNVGESLNILSYANDFKGFQKRPTVEEIDINEARKLPFLPAVKISKNQYVPNVQNISAKGEKQKKSSLLLPPILSVGNTRGLKYAPQLQPQYEEYQEEYCNELFEKDESIHNSPVQIQKSSTKLPKLTQNMNIKPITTLKSEDVSTKQNPKRKLTTIKKYTRLHELLLKQLDVYHRYVSLDLESKANGVDKFGEEMASVMTSEALAIRKIDPNFSKKFFLV